MASGNLWGYVGDLLDAVVRGFVWLKNNVSYWWGVLVGLVVVPLNWLADSVLASLVEIEKRVVWMHERLGGFIDGLHISSLWEQSAPVLAKVNAIFPLNFLISCCVTLLVLWVVCFMIRIVRTVWSALPFV